MAIPEQRPDPAYEIYIAGSDSSGHLPQLLLHCWTPAKVALASTSHWNAPFSSFGSDLLNNAVQILNVPLSTRFQWMSKSYWQNTEPLQLTIPLELRSVTNSYLDVYKPWQSLIAWTLPAAGGALGTLLPPGPTGGRNLSLYIGRVLYLPSVILTNVQSELRMITDMNGIPTKATVMISVTTDHVITCQDWNSYAQLQADTHGAVSPQSLGG